MSNCSKTFALLGNTFQAEKSANILLVINSILSAGCKIVIEREFSDFLCGIGAIKRGVFSEQLACDLEADFAVSIGGDGTFLKTAELVGARQIPIVGINTGRLGFISDVLPKEAPKFFDDVAKGCFQIERRSLLMAKALGQALQNYPFALNEIAVLKHDISSMINIHTYVNDNYLATYQADGLVLSTPTGSTGYSLSAGGPIISPDSKSVVLSPIAAHSLSVRPFIVNDDVCIRLQVSSRSHNFMLAIDGRSEQLEDSISIEICRAPYPILIVRPEGHSFFDTLRQKLLWGANEALRAEQRDVYGINC